MTREKYESLPLSMLKALAKSRNMKGISTLRKEALIERMLEEDQKENQKNMEEPAVLKEEKKTETVQDQNQEPQEKREDGMERQNRETSENGTARPYQRPRYVRREERSENGERQEYRPRAPRFNERRFQEPRNYNQNNREEEQRQEPRQEAGQEMRQEPLRQEARPETRQEPRQETSTLDSGQEACGILEVMPDGFGFIRSDNYMPGDSDVYVSPSQIRRFGLKTGDIIRGNTRVKSATEKFSALLYLKSVNNLPLDQIMRRGNFEDMTPVFPDERLRLERPGGSMAMRIVDLVSPIGKGQRGMIVSPPKAGKTTLLKDAAKSILRNNPEMYLIILLIDERPEEVTDIKEAIQGSNVEVIYSTFDEQPEHHKRVSEMVIERAKRLVESKKGRYDLHRQHHTSCQSLQPDRSAERPYPFRRSRSGSTLHAETVFRRGQKHARGRKPDDSCNGACGHRKQDGRCRLRGIQRHRKHGTRARPETAGTPRLPGHRHSQIGNKKRRSASDTG